MCFYLVHPKRNKQWPRWKCVRSIEHCKYYPDWYLNTQVLWLWGLSGNRFKTSDDWQHYPEYFINRWCIYSRNWCFLLFVWFFQYLYFSFPKSCCCSYRRLYTSIAIYPFESKQHTLHRLLLLFIRLWRGPLPRLHQYFPIESPLRKQLRIGTRRCGLPRIHY